MNSINKNIKIKISNTQLNFYKFSLTKLKASRQPRNHIYIYVIYKKYNKNMEKETL